VFRVVPVVAAFALVGACAEAGKPDRNGVDANGKQDGGKAIDARPADAPSSMACASSATCATATALANISGDTGLDMQTASGYQAAWYSVRVSENDSSPIGVPMVLDARLVSPATASYDVYVYVNKGNDVIECNTPAGTATRTGTSDELRETWGETGTFANGADDSRTVSIEIRPTGTSCSAANPWQLTLTGDD
jgi:hypothetical protein